MNRVQAERLLRGGAAGIERWNAAVQRDTDPIDLRHLDLAGAHLLGVDLRTCDLRGAQLGDANLIDSVLLRVNLSGARMQGANLGSASVHGADLSRADLDGASLRAATATAANFTEANLEAAILVGANLRGADLSSASLQTAILADANLVRARLHAANAQGAIFAHADMKAADFREANCKGANFEGAQLSDASFRGADLTGATLRNARLRGADFSGATLQGTVFAGADVSGAIFEDADLTNADMTRCRAVGTNFKNATLTHCRIFGISTWDMDLEGAVQSNLVITRPDQPTITADNVEVAQFLYMLLNHSAVRGILDTMASKIVLILGRFTVERKRVLDQMREALREHDYLPILFDFDKPSTRDLTETIATLAHMSRFIIADLTDPSAVPHELASLIPGLPSVPVQPILHQSADGAYGMFEHWKRYPWVLDTFRYRSDGHAVASLAKHIIRPVEHYLQAVRPPPAVPYES